MRAKSSCSQSQARAIDRAGPFTIAALYGSLVLIGAVVFGTLSLRPF